MQPFSPSPTFTEGQVFMTRHCQLSLSGRRRLQSHPAADRPQELAVRIDSQKTGRQTDKQTDRRTDGLSPVMDRPAASAYCVLKMAFDKGPSPTPPCMRSLRPSLETIRPNAESNFTQDQGPFAQSNRPITQYTMSRWCRVCEPKRETAQVFNSELIWAQMNGHTSGRLAR